MALVKYNNNSISAVTAAASIPSASLVPIKTLTASSSATLSFVHGTDGVVLDSTYPIYKFEFINMHPSTDAVSFLFQANAVGGSGFNETITSTFFRTRHRENGTDAGLSYDSSYDLAQSTNFQTLAFLTGNDNDQSCSGYLQLFNPSSTTFVKHFISKFHNCGRNDHARCENIAGYFNTTSAIDEISFKFESGNIDSGKIKLYGIKDS